MDSYQLDHPLHFAPMLQNMSDDVVVRTVFAEMQPFKRVKNYFTNFLLYQENNETVKEP